MPLESGTIIVPTAAVDSVHMITADDEITHPNEYDVYYIITLFTIIIYEYPQNVYCVFTVHTQSCVIIDVEEWPTNEKKYMRFYTVSVHVPNAISHTIIPHMYLMQPNARNNDTGK